MVHLFSMSRLIPLLLLCLLLFTMACKKEDAEPSLEGRWEYHSSTAYRYDHNGNLLGEGLEVEGAHYLVVKGSSVQCFRFINGRYQLVNSTEVTPQREMVRRDSILKPDEKLQVITKLTSHHLTLRDKTTAVNPAGGLIRLAYHYVR